MKFIKLNIIALSLIITACGGDVASTERIISGGDPAAIQQQKELLQSQIKQLETEIGSLDDALAKLGGSRQKNVMLVTALQVKDTLFKHFLELQGTVKTEQNITLDAEYSGMLERVYAKKGQNVQRGQLLASIQDGGMRQQLAQLKTQAELAKTTFERQARLWENKIGSEIQYLQAKSSYESQQSAVAQMQQQLDKTNVYAPFSGTIDDIITDQGTIVAPGTPIIRLVNLSEMYLEAEVPEMYTPGVKKGTEAKVLLSVLGKEIDAKISQVSNFINPANRSFRVEVQLPNKNGDIKPNMTARLQVNDYTNEKAILVPVSVISENAEGEQYLFIAVPTGTDKEYKAEQRVIKSGKSQNGMAEILSGLNPGETIINEGARNVQDGQLVTF
ncbi:MAG: efflux RND transporter periplasmic adaptor subunit [Capnocytophaga sp.]|nr:efflux RND transporter periplasmic adaptor subunit [Capnocytophaga sp.]